jgi:16S rRNA (cytosine1402-N4)-methyltransferase
MTEAVPAFSHDPVLIDEVIGALQPRDGGAYVDGTFGAGSYTRAILDAADCRVWAIDRDPDAVNEAEESILADIIYRYGEERQARRIARAIVAARADGPLTRTGELANIVRDTYRGGRNARTDPATKTFQAIRIHINDELGELKRGLDAAEILLAPGGRLAVVSFHSLEDRIVKEFLRARSDGQPTGSRHLPVADARLSDPTFRLIKRGAIKPAREEEKRNPRSRSARLRVAERSVAPHAKPAGGR